MAKQNKIGKVATHVTRKPDGSVEVAYHDTTVVKVDAGGRVTLDHGGWKTATTKTRMNQAANEFGLGFSVCQDKGKWTVRLHKKGGKLDFEATPISFVP